LPRLRCTTIESRCFDPAYDRALPRVREEQDGGTLGYNEPLRDRAPWHSTAVLRRASPSNTNINHARHSHTHTNRLSLLVVYRFVPSSFPSAQCSWKRVVIKGDRTLVLEVGLCKFIWEIACSCRLQSKLDLEYTPVRRLVGKVVTVVVVFTRAEEDIVVRVGPASGWWWRRRTSRCWGWRRHGCRQSRQRGCLWGSWCSGRRCSRCRGRRPAGIVVI
jgi:hypothetical protein